MEDLLGRMEVKRKNGKLVGGKMDAEGYREMGKVREALGMSEEELEAKLSGLEARLGKAEDEEERGKLEGEMALYSTFGNGRGMSMEGAAAAYEALRVWVGMNRFSWEEAQANQRVARREVVRRSNVWSGHRPSQIDCGVFLWLLRVWRVHAPHARLAERRLPRPDLQPHPQQKLPDHQP